MNLEDTNIIQPIIRATLSFIVLLISTRLLGKKQMSQLTFFNYITGITIGSIAANIITLYNQPIIDEFLGLIWWSGLTGLSGFLTLKSKKLRILIDDQPTIIIQRGKILKKPLTSLRMNVDDLLMLLREQNVFSIEEVDYAILEPNGHLSIFKKNNYEQVTKLDLNIVPELQLYLPTDIIIEGKIIRHNIKELNISENWVMDKLRENGINSIKDVFYAQLQKNGDLYINK